MHSRHHLIFCLLIGAAGSGSCLQKLDEGATNGAAPPPDFGSVAAPPGGGIPTILDENYPLRYGEDNSTSDPCVATLAQSVQIRQMYCGTCHGPNGTQGQPLFNFVLDDNKLTTTTDMTSKLLFIAAGDPDHSRVYQRLMVGTMPPIQVSVDQPDYPRPTVSDLSVLYQWIICLGKGRQPTSDGTGGGAGGTGGSTGGTGVVDAGSSANGDDGGVQGDDAGVDSMVMGPTPDGGSVDGTSPTDAPSSGGPGIGNCSPGARCQSANPEPTCKAACPSGAQRVCTCSANGNVRCAPCP